jgi:hypothetical protein
MSTLARRDPTTGTPSTPPPAAPARDAAGSPLALLVPVGLAVAIVVLAFSGGGFFAGATAVAEVVAAAALAAWIVLVPRPLAGLSPTLAVAAGALTAFALWVLLSSRWSDAPARALLEGDRAFLYALVVTLVGLAAADARVRRALPRLLGAALVVISVAGLVTRLLPHVWPVAADMEFERLSYPLGYWNGQGALAAIAAVLALHLASDRSEPRAIRAIATAALPLLATTVALTFSRGSIAAGLLGGLAYLVLARPRGAVGALLAAVPTTAIALVATLGSKAIVEQPKVTAAGVHAGGRAAIVVALCAVAAGVAALVFERVLEPRLPRLAGRRIPHARLVGAGVLALLCVGAIATGAPAVIGDKAQQLTRSSHVEETSNALDRLTQVADNGRIDSWKVSLDGFESAPLLGTGAGTFALEWNARRPSIQDINDGHSLFFETLGELGIVGLALIVAALGALLVGAARAARRSPVAAAGFAVLLAWTVHAAIDWDWEVPALTIPALAFAAAAVARPRTAAATSPATTPNPGRSRWAAVVSGSALMRAGAVVALVAVAAIGTGVARSQHALDQSLSAMHEGNCVDASRSAQRSLSINGQRPEPHQVLAVCALRAADPSVALIEAQRARELDPANWRMAYDVAMVQAIAGQDPRAMLREARRLNPRSWLLIQTQERFGWTERKGWPALGQKAGLLV